jgi:hypothetical protein
VATCILEVAKLAPTLPTTINQPSSVAVEVEPTMSECVLPTIEGVIHLTDQVNSKLLKHYFNTGEAVDHSILAPYYPQCSNGMIKLQGQGNNAKSLYVTFSMNFIQPYKKLVTNCCDTLHVNT